MSAEQDREQPIAAAPQASVEFLQKLRAGGPWVLTAIVPDGPTTTITAFTEADVISFVRKHNGRRNIYYSVNPLTGATTKKASKKDIVAAEFVLADLDPQDDETPDEAKNRYLARLQQFELPPTAVVDSGNGIQALWRLASPAMPDAFPDVEARTKALIVSLGGGAGTQNVDRVLRLPGTINLPNEKKRRVGRAPCETRTLRFNVAAYPLDAFPLPAPGPPTPTGATSEAVTPAAEYEDDLENIIRTGRADRFGDDRSKAVYYVTNEMLRRGHRPETVVSVLLDRGNGISAHIYDQGNPAAYAKRQATEAARKIDFQKDAKGRPWKSQVNIRVALLKMGVTVRYDLFAGRTLIDGLKDFGPTLEDAAVDRLWLLLDQRFHFQPSKDLLITVLQDTARINAFHPVRDYLGGLTWDGKSRVDRWLTVYAGADDTEYTRAVGSLLLVAAVRRVRSPGAKFDELVVFESGQGTNKSSALKVLAIREDWFADDLPLNAEGKRVIEQLRGRWIVEAAELSGMRRTDIEHLKAFLSRDIDRARMSYGRLLTEVPRQAVIVGTTNADEYLRDTTGNRRFWPVRIQQFDLDALRRDRDQLWAEAAQREAQGIGIRLDPKLWTAAAEQQAQRLTQDPYVDTLQIALGDYEGKISAAGVWEILDVKPGNRTQDQNNRLGQAMSTLGWKRPKGGGVIRIQGKVVSAYVKGPQPYRTIDAHRSPEAGVVIAYLEDLP
ncbi:MAG: VapE domain-containing protein [Variibacter sp.]